MIVGVLIHGFWLFVLICLLASPSSGSNGYRGTHGMGWVTASVLVLGGGAIFSLYKATQGMIVVIPLMLIVPAGLLYEWLKGRKRD